MEMAFMLSLQAHYQYMCKHHSCVGNAAGYAWRNLYVQTSKM